MANITILHLSLPLPIETFNNHTDTIMKKIFLLLAAAIVLTSCGGNKDKKTGDSTILTFATNLENIDSLAIIVPATWKNLNTVTDTLAHSGKYASKIDSVSEFSLVYENRLGNISGSLPTKIKITAFGCSLQPDSKAIIVCSVSNDKFYSGTPVDSLFSTTNEWKEIKAEFTLPENLSADDVIKAYVWNKKVGTFLVDDMKLEFTY